MKKLSITFLLFVILTMACNSVTTGSTPPTSPGTDSGTEETAGLTNVQLPAGYGVKGSWFELYFSDPTSSIASQKTGGPDGPLVSAVDAAKLSVDVAIY